MRAMWRLFVVAGVVSPLAGQAPADTEELRKLLEPYRKYETYKLERREFERVQSALLKWVDQRVRGSKSVDAMNAELTNAGLILPDSDSQDVDESIKNNAGFLAKVELVKTVQTRDYLTDGGMVRTEKTDCLSHRRKPGD